VMAFGFLVVVLKLGLAVAAVGFAANMRASFTEAKEARRNEQLQEL
jgi:hypothetical protein